LSKGISFERTIGGSRGQPTIAVQVERIFNLFDEVLVNPNAEKRGRWKRRGEMVDDTAKHLNDQRTAVEFSGITTKAGGQEEVTTNRNRSSKLDQAFLAFQRFWEKIYNEIRF
jgi:hypothetical protein